MTRFGVSSGRHLITVDDMMLFIPQPILMASDSTTGRKLLCNVYFTNDEPLTNFIVKVERWGVTTIGYYRRLPEAVEAYNNA